MQPYDPADAVYPIDGRRTDLAAEFKARIRGPHSAELARVLQRMRTAPLAGRYVLVVREPFRAWVLGRLTGERGAPVQVFEDQVFHSLDAAEWAIFAMRWREMTGVSLDLG